MSRVLFVALSVGVSLWASARAAEPTPGKIRGDEAKAEAFSAAKAQESIDVAGSAWTKRQRCVTCHTNVPHLLAYGLAGLKPTEASKAQRAFFEKRATGWDGPASSDKPKNDSDVVATAVALAIHDAGTAGKLSAATKAAFARMWKVQQPDGAWDWEKCGWPPLEHDDYYGAVFAAVGVGLAPEKYAESAEAKPGLARLKKYLRDTPAPTLHHRMYLLWASVRMPELMTAADRAKVVEELKKSQKADGGWSVATMGDWKGFDGRDNDTRRPSDGYATGLALFVLKQAGAKADDAGVKKGLAWLKANQRESGRWYTESLNTTRYHYISNAGTAFALMAVRAWE